jgi:hypothetical protein
MTTLSIAIKNSTLSINDTIMTFASRILSVKCHNAEYPEQIFTLGNTANIKSTYYSSTHPPSHHRPLGLIAHSLFYFKDPVV